MAEFVIHPKVVIPENIKDIKEEDMSISIGSAYIDETGEAVMEFTIKNTHEICNKNNRQR